MSECLSENKYLEIYNTDYCYIIDSNEKIVVIEEKEDGKGTCEFLSKTPVLMIKAKNKNSAIWALKDQKCAEASFLEINEEGIILHIVEMKSKLSLRTFKHACMQIEGMYFASLGVISSLKLNLPVKVYSYIAYTELDSVFYEDKPRIFNKHLIGSNQMVNKDISYWNDKRVNMKHIVSTLITGERDTNGNYNFGYVN